MTTTKFRAVLPRGELVEVEFFHFPSPYKKAGVTLCEMVSPLGVFRAVAICSVRDRYSFTKGEKLSLTRAMRAANMDRTRRTALWEAYLYPTGPRSPKAANVVPMPVSGSSNAIVPVTEWAPFDGQG